MIRPNQAAEGIVRNAVFAGASKIAGAAFTAVLTIFLVRYLGPKEYGVFALAMEDRQQGDGQRLVVGADVLQDLLVP